MKSKKVFILGIDSGMWDVYDQFIEDGYMPYLASLKEQSSIGILQSSIPPITLPAWTEFQTGVNGAKIKKKLEQMGYI